jgi:hypothetical protein
MHDRIKAMLRRLFAAATAVFLVGSLGVGSVFAAGHPAPSVYVDGTLYRTFGTPTDFTGTGAPDQSFDTIYNLNDPNLFNVADSAPGDRDYNGGRWKVLLVTWHVAPYQLYSDAQVWAAQTAGDLTVNPVPVKEFLCPVIPINGR